MKKFNKEIVDKFAESLLIGLTEEENKMVLDEFEVIEESMDKITFIPDISSLEPMTHPLEQIVILREDEIKEELPLSSVLKNAGSNVTEEEIVVPKVVE